MAKDQSWDHLSQVLTLTHILTFDCFQTVNTLKGVAVLIIVVSHIPVVGNIIQMVTAGLQAVYAMFFCFQPLLKVIMMHCISVQEASLISSLHLRMIKSVFFSGRLNYNQTHSENKHAHICLFIYKYKLKLDSQFKCHSK